MMLAAPRTRWGTWRARSLGIALALSGAGCATQDLEAGSTRSHGLLPVDERNPIILTNDGVTDNWQGEYAVLLANGGGPRLAGILVSTGGGWPDIDTNVSGWRDLVSAARTSGLQGIPDPIASASSPLTKPASGAIEDTKPNRSEGATLILEKSAALSLPYRPLVVVTGGRLTDIADAYLIDPSVAQRVVVVASLGQISDAGAKMATPNGESDSWADTIVTAHFPYVQVSAYYDQSTDVPSSRLSQLPDNAFGTWIAAKQAGIYDLDVAADQVGVAAVGISGFAVQVERVSPAKGDASTSAGPDLTQDTHGSAWLVSESAGALATARFWQLLLDPQTFSH